MLVAEMCAGWKKMENVKSSWFCYKEICYDARSHERKIMNVCVVHHTHTPNQELHMQPHLPGFYHNNTLLYCILSC